MPDKNKKLPEITDYLDEFVDKLLNRIADESEDGRISLIAAMVTANQFYKVPIDSWTTGWFYQYFRTRGPDIEQAITNIGEFPDACTRLQELKILVEKGEWSPNSSYNYYLFIELIKSVPGYKPLDDDLVHPITIKVKDKIINRIDNFMTQYKANQKLIENREKERLAIQQSIKKSVDNVLIFNNLKSAQASAEENPAKIHFSLFCSNKLWQLSWIDLTGKVYKLDLGDELITTLIDQEIEDVQDVTLLQSKHLKQECTKARELFLDKVQVQVNPKDPANHLEINNVSLIDQGVAATFILRGKANAYSLYWISTLGKINEISLDKYPLFKNWLNDQNTLSGDKLPQLKSYLLHVNTASSLNSKKDMIDFKSELQACLGQGPKTARPIKSVLPIKPPKRLDLSLFAGVAKCLGEHQALDKADLKEKQEADAPQGRLNLDNYAAVSSFFGNKQKVSLDPADEPKSFIRLGS